MSLDGILIAAFAVFFVGNLVYQYYKRKRDRTRSVEEAAKSEALFQTMYPDLQPLLHPSNVVDYVLRRVSRGKKGSKTWDDPPGFGPSVKRVEMEDTPKGERTTLFDAAGAKLGEFLFLWGDKAPTIGMVRVGEGKFRVKEKAGRKPWASYWHPRREFDWRGPGLWTFRTTVTDSSIDSSDRGTSWSSSPSTTTAAAAATAGVVAAGGTFDGGGASAAWDGGGASGGGSSSGGSDGGGFDNVSSGSSSSSSTSY